MREIFPDDELNRKANLIVDKAEEIASKVMRDPFNGVTLAKQLLDSTLPILESIKNSVGVNNHEFRELSTTIAIAASGSMKFCILPFKIIWLF